LVQEYDFFYVIQFIFDKDSARETSSSSSTSSSSYSSSSSSSSSYTPAAASSKPLQVTKTEQGDVIYTVASRAPVADAKGFDLLESMRAFNKEEEFKKLESASDVTSAQPAYDKKSSFFDNLTVSSGGGGGRGSGGSGNKSNVETFGESLSRGFGRGFFFLLFLE
jgi:hypothetical protein